MPRSKLDIAILVLASVTFVSAFAEVFITSNGTIPNPSKIVFSIVLISISMVLIFGYASYWAFNIRRGLVIGSYRKQALGIALIGAIWGITTFVENVSLIFTFNYTSGIGSVLGFLLSGPPITYVQFLAVLYFFDGFVLTSRRSDPDFRDILSWTKLRKPMLGLVLFCVILDVVLGVYIAAYIPAYNGSPLMNGINPLDLTLLAIVVVPYFVTVLFGALALPIIARRSKDLTLRKQLKWFGLFVIFLLLSLVAEVADTVLGAISGLGDSFLLWVAVEAATFAATGLAGYCLYRSAKALIPGAEKLPTLAAPRA